MLESEGCHRGAVVGAGEDAVGAFEVEVVFIDAAFLAGGEDGDDVWVWGEKQGGLEEWGVSVSDWVNRNAGEGEVVHGW